jgi:hypothetical protein
MLCTKSGYKISVIFSLFAKSKARLYGILSTVRPKTYAMSAAILNSPDALQMHRANLDDMAILLALQDTISSPARHSGHIQQLSTVDHSIV